MKHTWKVTLVVLALFLLTQLIGLAVIKTYTVGWPVEKTVIDEKGQQVQIVQNVSQQIPYGFAPPPVEPKVSLITIIIAIIVATLIILFLGRIRANLIIKLWFAFVVLITTAITLSAVPFVHSYLALGVAALLTYFKIFRRDLVVHNLTELMIYPGLAAIFVPILNIGVTILLLLFLSIYDFYAVIKSKHMIELAKYQMKELKIFTGFFLPYLRKEDWKKIREARRLEKLGKARKKGKEARVKVNVAILGGGDVAFPLIFAGVVLKTFNNYWFGAIVAVFSTAALLFLLTTAKKGKFYPAMPFITVGTLLGYGIVWLLNAM